MDKELLKGSIDILILSLLAKEDMYGFLLAKRLNEKSGDFYEMGEGTLYPALLRLERQKKITAYWGEPGRNARRKYYAITEEGRQFLDDKSQQWDALNRLILACRGDSNDRL